MPKSLYNEGRVVGLSAYELYVKHSLSENPEVEPLSEREWLSALLGRGQALILKVPQHTTSGMHYLDFPLPENSLLCACNTIVASQFFGNCVVDDSGMWATKVTDYGQGLSNTSSSHPDTSDVITSNTYPPQTLAPFAKPSYSDSSLSSPDFLQYMKIQDGIILHPGTWETTTHRNPYKDFSPNLGTEYDTSEITQSVVRLVFTDKITKPFYILLTGFTNRSILYGVISTDLGSTAKLRPENGDFLGPELYPWANKIIFTQSPIASKYIRDNLSEYHKYHASSTNSSYPGSHTNQKNLSIDKNPDSIDTIFRVSDIYPGPGLAVEPPTNAGDPIKLSSKMSSSNNYLKVTQSSKDVATQVTSELTASPIAAGRGITVNQPASPGASATVSAPMDSSTYITVTQNNGRTSISLNENAIKTNIIQPLINNAIEEKFESVYPVGSLYITTSNKNPADLLGFGYWVLQSGNYYLRLATGAADVDTTGGTNTASFKLSPNQLPKHQHFSPLDTAAHRAYKEQRKASMDWTSEDFKKYYSAARGAVAHEFDFVEYDPEGAHTIEETAYGSGFQGRVIVSDVTRATYTDTSIWGPGNYDNVGIPDLSDELENGVPVNCKLPTSFFGLENPVSVSYEKDPAYYKVLVWKRTR